MKKLCCIFIFLALFSNTVSANSLYYYTAARLKMNERNFTQAAKYLIKSIDEDSDSIFLRYELLVMLFKMKLDKDALNVADAILKAAPDHLDTLIIKGNIEYIKKDFSAAKETFEKIIEIEPYGHDFYLPLSSIYIHDGEYKKAISLLRKGLEYWEEDSALRYDLAILYDKIGKRIKGIREAKKILKYDPENANALNFIGYTLCDMGYSLKRAEKFIRKALELEPDSGYIIDSLGWLYYKKEEYEKAYELILKAHKLINRDPIVLEHLGDINIKFRKIDEALKYYKEAHKLYDNDKDYQKRLQKKIDNIEKKKR